MGRRHLDDYFWHVKREELGPLKAGYEEGSESDVYNLFVVDDNGVKTIDFEKYDLEKVKSELYSIIKSLEVKGYEVNADS